MHARRKLRHVQRFQELKNHTPEEISWLHNAGINIDDVIGCYRCLGTETPAQTIAILEDRLVFWNEGRIKSIPFQDIASVSFNDGQEKSVTADGLAVQSWNGEITEIVVDSGDELTGARDSFMVKTFLENVVHDASVINNVTEVND